MIAVLWRKECAPPHHHHHGMKKRVCHVILSAAKNLKRATDHDGSHEILRCAQNDRRKRVFQSVLIAGFEQGFHALVRVGHSAGFDLFDHGFDIIGDAPNFGLPRAVLSGEDAVGGA